VAAPVRELRPVRRRRLLVGIAAVALVAAMSTAGATWLAGESERPVGIRTALAADNEGRWRCRAVVYGEKPTWLVVSLDRMDGSSNSYSVEALRAGNPTPVPVGSFTLDQGHGTFARPVDLAAGDLESVRVLDSGGRVRYVMTFAD
jgi:hypothetical protein